MPNDFREFRSGDLRGLEDRLIHSDRLIRSGRIVGEDFLHDRLRNRRGGEDVLPHSDDPLREVRLTPHPDDPHLDEPIEFIKPFEINGIRLRSVGIRIINATIVVDQPLQVGDYYFWPTKDNHVIFVCRRIPQIRDFQLVLHKEVVGSTIKITGGSLSYIADISLSESEMREQKFSWGKELEELGKIGSNFEPLDIETEEHELELPKATIHTSNSLWKFVQISLSESGALMWKELLENKQGEQLPGVHQVTITYSNGYTDFWEEGRLKPRLPSFDKGNIFHFSLPASIYLGQFGPEVITLTDPKIENETHVIVSGDPIVEHVIVTLIGSNGLSMSQTFTSEGGKLSHKWTTDEMQTLEVNWEAVIKYSPKGWPEVKESGKLSAHENKLITMIKPEAWLRKHALTFLLVDNQGKPLPDSSTQSYQVYAEFIFTAPFIEGNGVMRSTYQMESQKTLDLSFPKPPEEGAGVLELRVSAFVNNNKNLRILTLKEDEIMVTAQISPDANIVVETNKTIRQ
ncbi:hypothetical protein [Paenibacillus luteus]|uniref:hypothetical protein n=1 Tax=Paenibacillus luteus TaxID=2545753 RepID=UPI001143B333|nr:hypothetical protein [Paenibacillus luteus]